MSLDPKQATKPLTGVESRAISKAQVKMFACVYCGKPGPKEEVFRREGQVHAFCEGCSEASRITTAARLKRQKEKEEKAKK